MRSTKTFLLKLFAIAVCTIPVAAVTLSYFPVWKSRSSGALLSGFTVFLLIICFSPISKAIKNYLRSPSVFNIWLIMFIAFMIIKSIAYEMTVISFVGMISNLVGSLIFRLCDKEVKNEELSGV